MSTTMKLVEETTIDAGAQRLNDFMETQTKGKKEAAQREKTLTSDLGIVVTGYIKYRDSNNFSFDVSTELEAYKAAYYFRFQTPTVADGEPYGKWRVIVYPA